MFRPADLGSRYEAESLSAPAGSPVRFEAPSHPFLRLASAGAALAAAYAGHRYGLAKYGQAYAERLYRAVNTIETRSPGQILKTFRAGEIFSSYLLKEASYIKSDIFSGGQLTTVGRQLQSLLGREVDLAQHFEQSKLLRFLRPEGKATPYLSLEGRPDIQVRFMRAGTITKSSLAYKSGLSQELREPPVLTKDTPWGRFLEWVQNRGAEQVLRNPRQGGVPADLLDLETQVDFFPVLSRHAGRPWRNLADTGGRVAFELANRPMGLLASFGAGLRHGTYDRLAHVPFLGQGGLLNELFKRRVFPAAAGLGVLGYADYLTGHVVRDAVAGIPVKADILRAELTDRVPFVRDVTDFYEEAVPGPQYGPLALPLGGAMAGAGWHYFKDVLPGKVPPELRKQAFRGDLVGFLRGARHGNWDFGSLSAPVKGALVGAALMLPFLPGMLGSRETADEKRAIYSGEVWEPVRSGRWWDLGATPFEGNRIIGYRPNWYAEMKSGAGIISAYGSEEAYWEHHPIVSPFGYFSDPYFVERQNLYTRPYPITSPAFADVPLIGPLLAGTIGKVVKPPVLLHPEYSDSDYTLFSSLVEPRGPEALPVRPPEEEFGLADVVRRQTGIFAEFIGLPGFLAETAYNELTEGIGREQPVYFEGSRQMTSLSRSYYEREMGALFGASLEGPAGMSEPFRRFVQRDPKRLLANEIPNRMPSWLPYGDEYPIDFHTGDPYTKVKFGHLRLPGPGFEALHPELQGLSPEEYPAIVKFGILADVAQGSSQFYQFQRIAADQAETDLTVRIRYEQIMAQLDEVRRSSVGFERRRFTGEIESVFGTVETAGAEGVTLAEYPGRLFRFSGVGTSAADLSSLALGELNREVGKSELTEAVWDKQQNLAEYLSGVLRPGTSVRAVVEKGALQTPNPAAVLFAGGGTINEMLVESGLAVRDTDSAGPEIQAMYGLSGQLFGRMSEGLAFRGDESPLNPLRYIPNPAQTKLWQVRGALEQYQNREMYGSRMRRWDKPVEDYLIPYAGGAARRFTGQVMLSPLNAERRDLNTMVDMLRYLRALQLSATDPSQRGRYTSQAMSTAVGTNVFSRPEYAIRTLPRSERPYFFPFLAETDPERRAEILASVGPEMSRALAAQYTAQQLAIAQAEGKRVSDVEEGGRQLTERLWDEYEAADTRLNFGDWQRSKEIAYFFSRKGLTLPGSDSPLWSPNLDYEDVKLKIVESEGYDLHDFGLFEDRAAVLWRKPYLDGAVRELTAGGAASAESLRRAIEELMLRARGGSRTPDVRVVSTPSLSDATNIRYSVRHDYQQEVLRDVRRNPEEYR